jgi:hypothetical protein
MKTDLAEKIRKVIEAAGQIGGEGIIHIDVHHNDGCPALKTYSLEDCTCQPEIKRMGQA